MDEMYLLFDIGGTNTRVAISKDIETIGETRIFDTPKDFKGGIELIAKTGKELSGGSPIKAAAGGLPGPLDREKTKIVNAPRFDSWLGKPFKSELEKALGSPVYIENDAAVIGLGEAVYGAGIGKSIVVYMTVSTGVGGARIVDGRIDNNSLGFEPGHQILCFESGGNLESYVSGSALEKKLGKKPYEITDPKLWEELAKYLAYGLANTIVHWSPDIVVLGGSMMKKVGIPIERVRLHLKNSLKIFPQLPPIEKAKLGDLGGLYGGLVLLKQNLT